MSVKASLKTPAHTWGVVQHGWVIQLLLGYQQGDYTLPVASCVPLVFLPVIRIGCSYSGLQGFLCSVLQTFLVPSLAKQCLTVVESSSHLKSGTSRQFAFPVPTVTDEIIHKVVQL